MNKKHYTKFILILISILVIPIGTVIVVDSGIAQEEGKELPELRIVYSEEKFIDPEHQELVELLKYYRKIGDSENAIKILERLSTSTRESLYQSQKINDISFEMDRKEESEISKEIRWETSDVAVMATTNHEKSPSIETLDFGSMNPNVYIAAEYWSGTTSANDIEIKRSPYYGSGPNWWTGGYTLTINSYNPLSLPKIKQTADQYLGVVWVDEYSSTDHDIYFARVNATDFSDTAVVAIDTSGDDHVRPVIASDYIDFPGGPYIYVVYYKVTGSTAQLLYRRSTDNGTTWSDPPTVLAEFTEGHVYCSIDYYDGELYVAYGYYGGSSDDIAVMKSSDFGSSWTSPTAIASDSTKSEWYPEITVSTSDDVFVAYEYHSSSTDRDVYYAYTSDGGNSWNTNNPLATSLSDERYPSVRSFKGELEVYASYVKLPTQVMVREAVYTSPTSWTSELNVKNSAFDVSDDDPVALLPKYSPDGDVGAGIAWASYVSTDYDIHFNAYWLPCAPGEFFNLSPSNGETNISLNEDLDWENSINATSYDVYFGTSSPPPYVETRTESNYDPGTLNYSSTYYWKIVAKNGCGSTEGSEWNFTTISPPSVPEIDIKVGATGIADGGSYDFGSHEIGIDTDVTFTIENNGTAGLTLVGSPIIVLGGPNPDQFSVEQQPTSPVDPGGNTTFIIRFSPTSAGYKSASISIGSNDADEHPYDITLEGTGMAFGSLLVDIEPQGAIDAGAQWKRLCTTTWNDSGFEESGLSEGSVIVEFKDIPGWLKPDNQIVTITAGDTSEVTGIYTQLFGSGEFVDSGQNLGSSSSRSVALGDVDGDGDLDAFVVNSQQPNKVWLNDGAGIFSDSGQALGNENSNGVALGDLDADGDLDAIVTNWETSDSNEVWLNDGSGTFTDSGQSLGTEMTWDVALGDVDCDGDLDAFIGNSGNCKVFLNDGSGIFTNSGQSIGSLSQNYFGIVLSDVDGDGDLDAFTTTASANKVWFNDGSGNFTDSGQSLGSSSSRGVAMGDVDGDGDLDAFVANWSDQPNELWINNGSGSFTNSGQSFGASSSWEVVLGDVDGDGDLDAFVGNALQPNKVWLNDGTGIFSDSGQNLGSSDTRGIAMGDVDGDSDLDVFVTNTESEANKVWLNACQPPTIDIQPQSQAIDYNTTEALSVTASSASPVSYQWYQGNSGDTSTPVGSDSDSYTTPNLTEATSYWVRVSNDCGSTDSDTATINILPAPFVNLSPADSSTDVNLDADLDWEDGSGATSYDVYLGITSPPAYAATVSESYYDPGGLGACETYYWKIVAKNEWGNIEGSEWSFSTIIITPGNFSYLSPADFVTGVQLDANLDWEDSTGATTYDVYFGTSDPPPYVTTVNESYYDPGVLDGYTTYYWSVQANNSCGTTSPGGWSFTTGGKEWTFMVYLDGDNNLESAGIDDFLEMASVGSNSAINIVVQFDRIDGYSASYGDWTTTKRFYITPGLTPSADNALEDLGELNHGDPQTLIDFVDWAKMNYPAEKYALILWNHGGGWRESKEKELQARLERMDRPFYKAVCWDNTDGEDTLYMDEVQNALHSTGGADLIGFDACLMAMIEVAYEIKNYGQVMVGSEETEPGDGWPYDTILQDLVDNPSWSSSELGQAIVNRYYESYGEDMTQSAIDLTALDSLAGSISSFAQAMMDSWNINETAVKNAASEVMTQVENALISEQHGSDWPGAHGIAVYFPIIPGDFDSDYESVIDFADDTQWEEFLQEFHNSMAGSWIFERRALAQQYSVPEHVDIYHFCELINTDKEDYYTRTQIAHVYLGGGSAWGFHYDDAARTYNLPFDFPYFGETIPAGTTVYVCTNGFVDFNDFYMDPIGSGRELANNKRIAPFWTDLRTNGTAQSGEDVYVTQSSESVVIRWRAQTYYGAVPVNVELVLYNDGRIQFNYDGGNNLSGTPYRPTIGISKGDGLGYNFSSYYGQISLVDVDSVLFNPLTSEPPSLPANPSPAHEATDVSVETGLDWEDCTGATSYDVYFGTSSPAPFITTVTSSYFDPGTLNEGTTYYWKIVARNDFGETPGEEWQFTTCVAPGSPTDPSPQNGATNITNYPILTWSLTVDNASSYDVYLGTASPPDFVGTVTTHSYTPGELDLNTTYFWKVIAKNSCGETHGSEWQFTTTGCPAPSIPLNPSPAHNAFDVPLEIDLDWDDCTAATSYDVYFGTSSSPPYIGNVTTSHYDPGTLEESTFYYWRVVAKNECGETSGLEWQFKTIGPKPWTFMVYLDGDNNLEPAGIDDFLEMASIGSSGDVNIVVQFDRIGGYSTSYGNWTSTKRFYITPGMTPTADNALQDLGELNHGDPQTLIDFINWAKENYPADKYALVLWNHGGGWRLDKQEREARLIQNRKKMNFKAVCWDDTNGQDSLFVDEVQGALNATGGGNLIGFDACLMGMVEVAYEIRDLGEVMVGSEETEPGDGWPYDTILEDLANNPDWSSAELGSAIVDRYYGSYGDDETQSAIDLSNMDNLAYSISALGQAMIDNWSSEPAAVKIAAVSVLSEIENSVIREQHGPAWRNAAGLAIYLPQTSGDFDSDYNTVIDFSNDTQWNEFIQAFHSSMGGSWIASMRQLSQDFAYPEHIDLNHFCSLLITEELEFYQHAKTSPEYEGGGAAQGLQDDDRVMTYALPFTFPYFGETIPAGRDIYICTNGYVDFESPVAEFANSISRLANNKRIAPLWADLKTSGSAQAGEDVYITHNPGMGRDPDNLVIRWVAETYGSSEPVNFELILSDDGKIQFNYDGGNADLSGDPPTIGISKGDGINRHLSDYNGNTSLTNVDSEIYTLKEIRTVNLTVEAGGGGTIFPLPGPHAYPVGQQITLAAVPDRYYDLDHWSGDLSGNQSPVTVTVNSDMNITANFFRIYPPSSLSVSQELNRTLLMGENINVLTWQDNPSNPSQKIRNYNIYSDAGAGMSLLDAAEEGGLVYWHRDVDKTQTYNYAVCAVTTRGVEGEPSFRSIQGESGPETSGQTRSTMAANLKDAQSGGERGKDVPIIIGPFSKETIQDKSRRPQGPLNFAAQSAFDYSVPEGRYIHILSWQANPESKSIDKYKIYIVEGDRRQLLAELDGDALEYENREVEQNRPYKYALIAVNKDKKECRPVYAEVK